LGVAKGYLGPAAQTFLSNELHQLGINANTVGPEHIAPLADHIREHAVRVMGAKKAMELADALARCDAASLGGSGKDKSGGHKLASDAAARLLATGRLRQAEKAYNELIAKHGDCDAYIGLAQAQAGLEDNEAALNTLREGAAQFAKAGDRASAVSLLASAVTFAPIDLAAHRRLAAALANQGDLPSAVEEYARYVDASLSAGDSRRALLEISYGRETLGDLPGLLALVDKISAPGTHAAPVDKPRIDGPQPPARQPMVTRAAQPAPTFVPAHVNGTPVSANGKPAPANGQPATAKATPAPAKATPAPAKADAPVRSDWMAPAPQKAAPAPTPAPAAKPVFARPAPVLTKPEAAARTRPEASHTAVVQRGAKTLTHAEPADMDAPVDVLARAGVVKAKKAPRPAADIEQLLKTLTPTGSGLDAAAMAASRAALLTSARDPRATEAVLDAARRLLALGKLQSASDVLLDFIGHGFTEREAQRLLIEIDCALGRRDVAKEKCNLLSHAYRLDGRTDVAEDVERLARIL
jgi:tetratricopeptide (TPR) repeat protein